MFVNAASYFLSINYHFHFTTNSYYSFLCDQICVKIKKIFKKILRFQCVTNESHKMLDSMTEKMYKYFCELKLFRNHLDLFPFFYCKSL